MIFTKVDEIPKRRGKHDLQIFIKEFAESDIRDAKVVMSGNEYKSPLICYKCLHTAIKNSGYRIRVILRNDEVYLTKDFED